jgi:hypothetical protein
MELCTPCAGTRPGAADPTRSKAAYPPPRWVFGYLLIECGVKILNCGALGIENIDFFMLWGQKILIFRALGTENIDFWCSGEKEY